MIVNKSQLTSQGLLQTFLVRPGDIMLPKSFHLDLSTICSMKSKQVAFPVDLFSVFSFSSDILTETVRSLGSCHITNIYDLARHLAIWIKAVKIRIVIIYE